MNDDFTAMLHGINTETWFNLIIAAHERRIGCLESVVLNLCHEIGILPPISLSDPLAGLPENVRAELREHFSPADISELQKMGISIKDVEPC